MPRMTSIVVLIVAALVGIGIFGRLGDTGKARTEPPRTEAPRRDPPRTDSPRKGPSPDAARRPDGTRILPAPSGQEQVVEVAVGDRQKSSVGTAFSLDGRGTWMTARHVADGCSRLFVLTGPRDGLRVQSVYVHPNADIAVIRTSRAGPPLAFTADAPRLDQTGYHFGYPKGEPGDVQSVLIGRMTMRVRGRYNTAEPVLVWAERTRVPEGEEHLGGISGGPSFDSAGRVNGVTVAGSSRRGRVFTADMASMRAALDRANIRLPEGAEAPRIVPQGFNVAGTLLRQKFSVAKVACMVDQESWVPGTGPRGPGGNR